MNERDDYRQAAAKLLDQDAVDGVLSSGFYAAPATTATEPVTAAPAQPAARKPAKANGKPTHYKVICISMYTEDLKRLDTMVDTLKSRGYTKANRSALIRYALSEVDLDKVPKGI